MRSVAVFQLFHHFTFFFLYTINKYISITFIIKYYYFLYFSNLSARRYIKMENNHLSFFLIIFFLTNLTLDYFCVFVPALKFEK